LGFWKGFIIFFKILNSLSNDYWVISIFFKQLFQTKMISKNYIQTLLDALNKGVLEKQQEIALSFLSAMAGESIFLLGAPGVAKSLIARRLKFAFHDAQAFEYLMHRYSTPEEIFGPVSIAKLKNEDKFERIVENYLPTSYVVFLDEIWKAGPSIQNALLTVLNEKVFRNGDKEIKLPMKALIAASNELPENGLEAIWDRFLLRLEVQSIQSNQNFEQLLTEYPNLTHDNVNIELKITDDIYESIQNAIPNIKISKNVLNVIHAIRQSIAKHNEKIQKEQQIYISDRRWKKMVHLMRTSALLNERNEVDLMDCFLMQHCLWNEVDQMPVVTKFVKDAVQQFGYRLPIDLSVLKARITELEKEIQADANTVKAVDTHTIVEHETHYYKITGITTNHNYILKSDFNSLNYFNKKIVLYYQDNYQRLRRCTHSCPVRKGSFNYSVVVEENEHLLDTHKTIENKKVFHPALIKYWDLKLLQVLDMATDLKAKIQQYKDSDLKHLRTNLFVSPDFAEIPETYLNQTMETIEKLVIDAQKVQQHYAMAIAA
jgi:MoxR-like ATPase